MPEPRPGAELGEQHRPETHLLPLVIEAALGGRQAVTVFGPDYPTPDGTCIPDYVHVEDVAAAHLLGLERLPRGGDGSGEVQTLNLGVGRGQSAAEVIARVQAVTGTAVPVETAAPRAGMIRDAAEWHRKGGFAA